MDGLLQGLNPCGLGDRGRHGGQPTRVPVTADGVKFVGDLLHERVDALGLILARLQVEMEHSAVAQRDTSFDFL